MSFSYFDYGEERRFSFLQVPKLLLTEKRYHDLSGDAKILYSLMLDRLELSRKNGWYDERGHPFIYFTLEDVITGLGIGHSKAETLLADLEKKELIRRVRQGLGKPNRIYVGRFFRDEEFAEIQITGFRKSGFPKNRDPDHQISVTNNTEYKETDKNKTKQGSIRFFSRETKRTEADYLADYLDEACGFEALKVEYPYRTDELDGIKTLILETCLSGLPSIRISGEEKPKAVVESRLKKLNINHIRYVMDCMGENTTKVTNMRQYLLAVLYHAPTTMGAHYQSRFNHDRSLGTI